jgi:hypothetical protein
MIIANPYYNIVFNYLIKDIESETKRGSSKTKIE